MIYQIAREIGAAVTTLKGNVDKIVLTGGMAKNSTITNDIIDYISFLGDTIIIPGEYELEALAEGAYRVLTGIEEAIEY